VTKYPAAILIHAFFIRLPNFLPNLNVLKFSGFEPKVILELFLSVKSLTWPRS